MYHRDDMFYLITATIVMHNMMVEEWIGYDEIENDSYYDVVDNFQSCSSNGDSITDDESGTGIGSNNEIVGEFDISNVADSVIKYKIFQGTWKK